ncbi:hypothetical protein Ahy_B08g091363 isoform A [Arachis hypogaea]|uniref:CCHC-type domain-containing protein n=1 Tax=Arachis hypogaea TaxID=3818 RepID=A0A444Y228_ARAHY|nr:hypothetical protein Ahy_B08g091363 isoform A [Arachis hypogaea]
MDKVLDSDEEETTGQDFWEKTGRPAPVSPPIKPKPGRPTKNRRKDKDEGGSGSNTRMKRKYNPIRCMFCGEVGHNKRTCKLKKQADAEEEARLMQLQLAVVDPNTDAPNELPNDNAHAKVRRRPPKGKGKRAVSPQLAATTATIPISTGTIKGSSAATTKKLASFMTFVPTPRNTFSHRFFFFFAWTSSKHSYHVSATATHYQDLHFRCPLWCRNRVPFPSTAARSATTAQARHSCSWEEEN